MADASNTAPVDPGDARGAGSPGWPAVGETRMINGRPMAWTGNMWLPAKMVT
ncbi:hypothetical protein MKK65_11850 [Methylobacterium sp. J-001]|uniref:hypothetical protein n=1 Tax=Methylobacterium sp. J-001 TaxID=2836609 RepID=UPI001FBA8290|nr:hypothetical protein [Methylobacterium sp. J-001]MCJ2117244.1 hypothetical protein [Methylobacterium sp. J-001]